MRLIGLLILLLGLVLAEDQGDDLVIASSGDDMDELVIVAEDEQRDEATMVEDGHVERPADEEFIDPSDFVGSEVIEYISARDVDLWDILHFLIFKMSR